MPRSSRAKDMFKRKTPPSFSCHVRSSPLRKRSTRCLFFQNGRIKAAVHAFRKFPVPPKPGLLGGITDQTRAAPLLSLSRHHASTLRDISGKRLPRSTFLSFPLMRDMPAEFRTAFSQAYPAIPSADTSFPVPAGNDVGHRGWAQSARPHGVSATMTPGFAFPSPAGLPPRGEAARRKQGERGLVPTCRGDYLPRMPFPGHGTEPRNSGQVPLPFTLPVLRGSGRRRGRRFGFCRCRRG